MTAAMPAAAEPGGADTGLAAEVRDVLAHLKRRRRWIVLGAVIMAGLGTVLTGFMPRMYTATTEIMVDPRGFHVFDNEVVPGGQVPDVQSALVETQSSILKSDSVLLPVVEQEQLDRDPEFDGEPQNALGAVLAGLRARLSGAPPPDKKTVALSKLGEAVKVARVPSSYVIDLGVQSRDAAKAARLARDITDTFVATQTQAREDAAKKVSDGLAMRLDELSAEVKRAETAVDTFKRENNIVDANGRPVNEQQLGDLTNQLTVARVRAGELLARYEQIQGVQRSGTVPDATTEVLQSAAITQLRARYSELKGLHDNLLTSLGPRHPSLLAATAQMEGARQTLFQEIGRIASSAKSDYERAKSAVDGLSRQVEAITRETGTVNTASIRLRELEREAQARRAVYESFLQRSRETREQRDLPGTNISVISPAMAPLKPGGLPAIVLVAIAAAFGASAAAMAILGWDHLTGRLMTPRQLSAATSLPVLAIANRRAASAAGLFRRRNRGEGPRAGTSARSLGLMREALNDVTPHLPPRIVLFMSGRGGAARAGLPLDLARMMAQQGDKVLLIDADDDRLTRSLGSGLGSNSRRTTVRRTGVANLSVMSWNGPFTRSRGAGTGQDGEVLALAADHDFIFVHGSVSNAALRLRDLAEAATNIVLIVDAEVASLREIEDIRYEVGPFAAKVDGFVWVTSGRSRARGSRDAGPASDDAGFRQTAPAQSPRTAA